MHRAAQLRREIETNLASRVPSALSPRGCTERERMPCGVAEVDRVLRGGVPVGAISELVGPESSGRTAVALSLMAEVTGSERVGAWVDVGDALDPEGAAACGVDLAWLLWVRCGSSGKPTPGEEEQSVVEKTEGAMRVSRPEQSDVPVRGGGTPHPRSEGNGMPEAIRNLMQTHGGLYDREVRRERRMIGTPGAPNRPLAFRPGRGAAGGGVAGLGVGVDREEQVATDRLPAHRGEQVIAARCAEPAPARLREIWQGAWKAESRTGCKVAQRVSKKPWSALEQALKATDLLLQAGGFSVVVFDMGSVPAEIATRVPLATWFRFRAACERTGTSLLLMTQHPCAGSSAEMVARMGAGQILAENTVMTGIEYRVEGERMRFANDRNVISIRKPPQPEHGTGPEQGCWRGGAAWSPGR